MISRLLLPAIVICSALGSASAQKFVAQSDIGLCSESGFYKIELHPDLTHELNNDFSNFRILSGDGVEVPYVIEEGSDYSVSEYADYDVRLNESVNGCCTNLIFENNDDKPISNVHLRIRNAQVLKSAVLSGSDDMTKWYAVRDKFYLDPVVNPDGVAEVRLLDFPLSNYRFYRLQMNDSTSEPLNILSVGFYRHMHRSASYAELSPARVSRIDSAAAKQTIIHLVLGTEHWIDRIRIEAAGPPFFLRAGAIYETSAIADKKGRSKNNAAYLEEFSLSNDEHAIVDVPSVRTNALRIVINNDDNPPLKDVVVKVQQRKRFAICYLEEGRLYRLMAGTEGMHAPRYDLAHFKHRLPVNMLSIGAAAFSPIAKERVQSDEKVDFLQTRYIVWVAIILIMVLLGGLSVRMIRENNLSGKS